MIIIMINADLLKIIKWIIVPNDDKSDINHS